MSFCFVIFEQLHSMLFTFEAQILFLAEEIGSLQQLEYKERDTTRGWSQKSV